MLDYYLRLLEDEEAQELAVPGAEGQPLMVVAEAERPEQHLALGEPAMQQRQQQLLVEQAEELQGPHYSRYSETLLRDHNIV